MELQEYVIEVCDGIKDHLVRDPNDPQDTRWEYTYHQRLFAYQVPSFKPFDQIEILCQKLAKTPHTRRAQAVTWQVWEDNNCYDPSCMQSVWCRILEEQGQPVLSMTVRFRSNDAYKAAFMNIFAFVELQQRIAARISELTGEAVRPGRYCHLVDSYHIYGSYFREFGGRFLGMLSKRPFEQRTMRYADVRDIMEEARPVDPRKGQDDGEVALPTTPVQGLTAGCRRARGLWRTVAGLAGFTHFPCGTAFLPSGLPLKKEPGFLGPALPQ